MEAARRPARPTLPEIEQTIEKIWSSSRGRAAAVAIQNSDANSPISGLLRRPFAEFRPSSQ
jgi:hypothetical protein